MVVVVVDVVDVVRCGWSFSSCCVIVREPRPGLRSDKDADPFHLSVRISIESPHNTHLRSAERNTVRSGYVGAVTIDQKPLGALHFGGIVAHTARIVARVIGHQMIDHQNAVVLVDVLHRHMLGGQLDWPAVLAPCDR